MMRRNLKSFITRIFSPLTHDLCTVPDTTFTVSVKFYKKISKIILYTIQGTFFHTFPDLEITQIKFCTFPNPVSKRLYRECMLYIMYIQITQSSIIVLI